MTSQTQQQRTFIQTNSSRQTNHRQTIFTSLRGKSTSSPQECNEVSFFITSNRGGVEDTRLEAKAKDTKKIRGQGQGQGQPFRGQTLSRPRTGMLEAKAKDQGHKAQVLSKKKKKRSSQKFFGDLQKKKKKKKGLHKNFSSDLHEKTLSKKFFNRSTKF